jgi:hypothetical protein
MSTVTIPPGGTATIPAGTRSTTDDRELWWDVDPTGGGSGGGVYHPPTDVQPNGWNVSSGDAGETVTVSVPSNAADGGYEADINLGTLYSSPPFGWYSTVLFEVGAGSTGPPPPGDGGQGPPGNGPPGTGGPPGGPCG